MLKATAVNKPVQQRLSIVVSLSCVSDESDADLAAAAMAASHETPSSLFGWHVQRYGDGTASVQLHRD